MQVDQHTTEPAVTLAVCVEAAEAQDPVLQRRSSEVTSVTWETISMMMVRLRTADVGTQAKDKYIRENCSWYFDGRIRKPW